MLVSFVLCDCRQYVGIFCISVGVFSLINGSKPLTKEILEKLLKRIYPDDSQVGKLHSRTSIFTHKNNQFAHGTGAF